MSTTTEKPLKGQQRNREVPEVELFAYPETPHRSTEDWSATLGANEEELTRRFAEVFPVARSSRSLAPRDVAADFGDGRSSQGIGEHRASAGSSSEDAFDPLHGYAGEEVTERMALECRRAEERGLSLGMELGLSRGREEGNREREAAFERLHAQAAMLLESFSVSKGQYFHQLEQESVRLALAIAARILRREAQMDPLLLTGAVRVALGQLSESTAVRLRVPVQEKEMWEQALALIPNLALRPDVMGEPRMELGECRMETALGTADLSLWAQLKEIERGFFDRVGDRVRGVDAEGREIDGLEPGITDGAGSGK